MSTHLFREASTPNTEATVSPSSQKIFVEAKANLVPEIKEAVKNQWVMSKEL